MVKRIDYSNGDIEFRLDGKLHRVNGPADYLDHQRLKTWWLHGRMHRYYGPYNIDGNWVIHGTIIK